MFSGQWCLTLAEVNAPQSHDPLWHLGNKLAILVSFILMLSLFPLKTIQDPLCRVLCACESPFFFYLFMFPGQMCHWEPQNGQFGLLRAGNQRNLPLDRLLTCCHARIQEAMRRGTQQG